MPDIIDDTFAAVGEIRADRLDLMPVDPAYRAVVRRRQRAGRAHATPTPMAAEIEAFAGAATGAPATCELRDWLTRLYRVEFDGFIAANFDSPLSLLTPQLARLAALGGFRRWDADGASGSSPTSGCAGSSPSRRCTPACRRSGRWPSTP